MVRTPLYFKLMLTYVLVVALAVAPTVVYVRMIQSREMKTVLADELKREVANLAAGLSAVPPEDLERSLHFALSSSPRRLTVLDPAGLVLGDSAVAGRVMENHLQRPEVAAAMASPDGLGTAERLSATVNQQLVYAAARYPRTGPVKGIVRLSASPDALIEASAGSAEVLSRAGAVAGTAAILLSLVAALVVSRPLRRIAAGARAFAKGDFSHDITVHSRDELGEVSEALEELAARLRERLHSMGAERAGLHTLIDDLPVGVVVYNANRDPDVIGGQARVLCELSPDNEHDRCHAILALPEQAAVAEQVQRDGITLEVPLELPWKRHVALRARWIGVPLKDGSRQLALVVSDEPESARQIEQARSVLADAARMLREAARASSPIGGAGAGLAQAAARCEALLAPGAPDASEIQAAVLSSLCDAALADVAPIALDRGVTVHVDHALGSVKIVEAGGRVERAVRSLILLAVREAVRGERIALRTEVRGTAVRLITFARSAPALDEIGGLVRAIGGEVGLGLAGEKTEAWLQVPKA